MGGMNRPKCSQCRHFYITYNLHTPNGCSKFGIQCKDAPSKIIASAGMGECQGFEPKKRPEAKEDPSLRYGN